ncbi:MAG: DUF5320 domain-containing protein [Clostridiales bacterium]|nr:DUF5320 domain-containing protein [Clostridiales bacterium]
MPRGDGTGPMGDGPMTGRGLGFCSGSDVLKYGAGLGLGLGLGLAQKFGIGRGLGRGVRTSRLTSKTRKEKIEMLKKEREILQKRLKDIDKQLKKL